MQLRSKVSYSVVKLKRSVLKNRNPFYDPKYGFSKKKSVEFIELEACNEKIMKIYRRMETTRNSKN